MVYKAHDVKLDRTVALKFLPDRVTMTETEKVRFVQEARAAAALNHRITSYNVCYTKLLRLDMNQLNARHGLEDLLALGSCSRAYRS